MVTRRDGFTIVEIIVVIVTIAILAAISIVAYVGIKEKAVASSLMSDLDSAKKSLDMKSFVSTASVKLPDSYEPSRGNHVELVKVDLPYYESMTPVQNGVLFFNICGDLIAAGYGKGVNKGGGTDQYITACNVYEKEKVQVNNSWKSQTLNIPVQANALQNIADSIHNTDDWFPEREPAEKLFYTTWNARFLAQGGTYPVTSFWDNWASGVQKEDLPAPTDQKDKYCLEAYNDSYPDMHYMVVNDGAISEGSCPSTV